MQTNYGALIALAIIVVSFCWLIWKANTSHFRVPAFEKLLLVLFRWVVISTISSFLGLRLHSIWQGLVIALIIGFVEFILLLRRLGKRGLL